MPYVRLKSRREYAEPRVLDAEKLQKLWRPWIDLHDDPQSHLIARNASILWNHVISPGKEGLLARPWAGTFASSGLRPWILKQARTEDSLTGEREPSAEMARLSEVCESRLREGSPLQRLQMTAMMGYLTISGPLLTTPTPDPSSSDPLIQHLCYERAQTLYMLDMNDSWSWATVRHLAQNASEPALRAMALAHLIGRELRSSKDIATAAPLVADLESVQPLLAEHPRWLQLILHGRIARVIAFYLFRRGDHAGTQDTLDAASAPNSELAQLTSGEPVLELLQLESQRLVLEVIVKSHIGRDPVEVADVIAKLDAIEPYWPESRFFIGELFAKHGELTQAAKHFQDAAQGGNARAALAAFRGFECLRDAGHITEAKHCLDLTYDLDPAIDVDRYADELHRMRVIA